jgi:hypothetical protein
MDGDFASRTDRFVDLRSREAAAARESDRDDAQGISIGNEGARRWGRAGIEKQVKRLAIFHSEEDGFLLSFMIYTRGVYKWKDKGDIIVDLTFNG